MESQTSTATIAAEAPHQLVEEPAPADLDVVRQANGGDGSEIDGIVIEGRSILRTSPRIDLLIAALAEAQAQDGYGDIEKSRTARVKSKKGEDSSYEYDYETLADVINATRPHLAKFGVSVLQLPFPGSRSITIRTLLTGKGQWIVNDLSALIPMPDPQAIGSGISYLRRYALKSILNVAASDEDDDGAAASRGPRQQDRPAAAPRKSATQPHVGKVAALDEKAPGAFLVTLTTGYRCTTANPELVAALRSAKADGAIVDLTSTPSSDPTKYHPILQELARKAS